MNSNDFCKQVLAQVHHATPKEKDSIQEELLNHLMDHAEELEEAGYSQKDANAQALSAMGNPEEIGIELNKQYPLGWLVLSRATLFLSIFLGLLIFLTLPVMGNVFENLQARLDPTNSSFASTVKEGRVYPLDIKVPIGNDVLYIYEAALEEVKESETGYAVTIALCSYDQNPFGIASQSLLENLRAETATGSELFRNGMSGGGNSVVNYRVIKLLSVKQTEKELYLCYDRFGKQVRVAVPLHWEVLE